MSNRTQAKKVLKGYAVYVWSQVEETWQKVSYLFKNRHAAVSFIDHKIPSGVNARIVGVRVTAPGHTSNEVKEGKESLK